MKKNKQRYVLLVLVLILFVTTAITSFNMEANAEITTTPSFTVEMNNPTPNPVHVGEDITISGTIIPEDFMMEIPAKEIVLVLDTSGSMDEKISGTKIKKIDALKEAAENFVNEMKEEPTNLKIAIVTYSTYSTINPESGGNDGKYNTYGEEFMNIDDPNVINSIKALTADGGTNMGEGLRKAAYLFDKKGNSNANRSIIFMSDGVPTYYSWIWLSGDFYKELKNDHPNFTNIKGNGIWYNSDAEKYGNEMAEIIKKYVNNSFTIGYGLGSADSQGNKCLQGINKSMGGTDDTFFASDDGAINTVFEQLAEQIKSTYTISNIDMSVKLNTDFVLSLGGESVSIPNVVYSTDNTVINGKIRYHADPVDFEFVIRGSKAGHYELLQNAVINVPWQNSKLEIDVPSVEIDIQDNEKPNINAVLVSEKEVTASVGQNIEVTYNITGEAFKYNNSGDVNNKKDVLIILDTSSSTNSYITGVKNALWNDVLNNSSLRNSDIRYGIITYNKDAAVLSSFSSDITQLNDNYIKNISCSNNNVRKLDEAMKLAVSEMKNARSDADKYIVLIGSDHQTFNINVSEKNSINNMLSGLTKFITLSVPNSNNNLEEYHVNDFKGSKDDYILTGNDAQNDIQNKYMKEVANRIIGSGTRNNHKFNVSLKFNLNDNFVVAQSDIDSNRVQVSGNNLTINNIIVEYNYNADTLQYEMIPQNPISFKISCKDEKTGVLTFGSGNCIEYTSIGNKAVTKNIATPKVTVISPVTDITHGIDLGIKDGQYIVREETLNMAAGVEATFASTARIYSNNTDILLSIDKNIDISNGNSGSTIKVYSCTNGVLSPLNIIVADEESTSGAYNYRIKINEPINPDTMIVVRYSCKLPIDISINGAVYTNTIRYGSESKVASVKVEKDSGKMPDLF